MESSTKLRQLTADEVEFSIIIEPEHIPARGNCMASDDPAFDKECEDAITKRLESGDERAWCCILIRATWGEFEAFDSLGGCSLDDTYTADVAAEEHGMKETALSALNEQVRRAFERLAPLLEASL